jgi:glucose/mannose-6-phosphate isomerase
LDLDNDKNFYQIDQSRIIDHIDHLPDQLSDAWQLGRSFSLPDWNQLRAVIVIGMGGSAIAADLFSSYVKPLCKIPVFIHRDDDLPAWVAGPSVLVIISSHSGNTEETLSAFEQANKNHCRVIAITTGGNLADKALQGNTPLWQYQYESPPRAAIGYSFGMVLSLFSRLNLIDDPQLELNEAISILYETKKQLKASVPVIKNPAKRLAGQLIDRIAIIFGYDFQIPVARRWKNQINELSKAWAQFEALPEADHNTIAGTEYPASLIPHMTALFLRIPSDHTRNRARLELAKKSLMLQGFGPDFVDARGNSRLAQLWSTLQFGDYTAYYLALAYGVDPSPIVGIEDFKREMSQGQSLG